LPLLSNRCFIFSSDPTFWHQKPTPSFLLLDAGGGTNVYSVFLRPVIDVYLLLVVIELPAHRAGEFTCLKDKTGAYYHLPLLSNPLFKLLIILLVTVSGVLTLGAVKS